MWYQRVCILYGVYWPRAIQSCVAPPLPPPTTLHVPPNFAFVIFKPPSLSRGNLGGRTKTGGRGTHDVIGCMKVHYKAYSFLPWGLSFVPSRLGCYYLCFFRSFRLSFIAHVGCCQNCGPFLGTLNIRCRIIIGIQKGTTILTTTHVS